MKVVDGCLLLTFNELTTTQKMVAIDQFALFVCAEYCRAADINPDPRRWFYDPYCQERPYNRPHSLLTEVEYLADAL